MLERRYEMRTLSDILHSVECSTSGIEFTAKDIIERIDLYSDDINDLTSDIINDMNSVISLYEDIQKELG
jgi:hypothetical protein